MPKYVLKRCPTESCGSCVCLRKISFEMAKYLLADGASVESELDDVMDYMRSNLVGKRVVSVDGSTLILNLENIKVEAEKVKNRAVTTVNGIKSCVSQCDTEPETYFSRSSAELQEVLTRCGDLAGKISRFNGSLVQARALADQMQSTLSEALDLGAGNLGIIVRQALAYGLADKLPAIDPSGLIFTGNLERLEYKGEANRGV